VQRTVIVVNDFAHVNGGASQIALATASALSRRGIRVILFAACEPVDRGLEDAGVEVVITNQRDIRSDPSRVRAAAQGIWNLAASTALEKVLRNADRSSTVIHVHSWTKALSSSVFRVASRQGFHIVCTLHDYFVACPNGGFFDYQRSEICHERPLSGGCITRNCDAHSYAEKLWRVARHSVQSRWGSVPAGVRCFIAVSNFSEEVLRDHLPANAVIHRIPNPIDVAQTVCNDAGANDRLAYVGRLAAEKGVLLFAAAAARSGLAPLFVGDGPLREDILRICPNAHITGWLDRAAVLREVSNARAIVVPSLSYETYGLVAAEAAALGIPAVVADTCAGRELVRHEETGVWFRGGDETDLVAQLQHMQTPDVARAYGRSAYALYWRRPSTMNAHVDRLLECYDQVFETCPTTFTQSV
jgi:glycosyltransferase involved in cell wall biosynthesis